MPMIEYNDTLTLMQAMERFKPAASMLLDTFFPNIPPTYTTSSIAVETRKGHRHLAPFVTREGKGVNIGRSTSKMRFYEPPMMAPRRVLNPSDIMSRQFGETLYSTMTPQQRAAAIQARDLRELQDMIINRKNKMAADILSTGKCKVVGYADDGKLELEDEVDFGFENFITPTKAWDKAEADIMGDLQNASDIIQEGAGQVPTIALCGKNVARKILKNKQLLEWLAVPNRQNFSIASLQPRITSPQCMYIGSISSLNLELYSYAETYIPDEPDAETGEFAPVPFLDPDTVIVAIPGRGKQLHGAVNLIGDDESFVTYAGNYVPYYNADKNAQTISLTVYSRCILVPEYVDDWAVIDTKGTE